VGPALLRLCLMAKVRDYPVTGRRRVIDMDVNPRPTPSVEQTGVESEEPLVLTPPVSPEAVSFVREIEVDRGEDVEHARPRQSVAEVSRPSQAVVVSPPGTP
jgi:hypothetical protein